MLFCGFILIAYPQSVVIRASQWGSLIFNEKNCCFLLNDAEKLQFSGVNLKDQTTDTEHNDQLKQANFLLD